MSQTDPYGPDWNDVRRGVYRRDKFACQGCGKTNVKLYAHHKRPLSKGGTNDAGNIESLCRRCHAREHPHLRAYSFVDRIKLFLGALFVLLLLGLFAWVYLR
ncbi:MAG: HNH endonuclease signature motif containing protein [Nanoarchaeota archaeon]